MENKTNYIPLKECIERGVYKISSRNLKFGVYNGKDGFIGIREKLGYNYLFTEYHYDSGISKYGTVRPREYLGLIDDLVYLGKNLRLQTIYKITYCGYCGDILESIEENGEHQGYSHITIKDCNVPYASTRDNTPLFRAMQRIKISLS